MKIQFLSGDSITAIKANLNGLRTKFGSGNEWFFNFFDGKSPFKDTKYDIEDFQLDMSQDDPFLTEYENVRRVYTHLKFLPDSQASDERIWADYVWDHFTTMSDIGGKLTKPALLRQ